MLIENDLLLGRISWFQSCSNMSTNNQGKAKESNAICRCCTSEASGARSSGIRSLLSVGLLSSGISLVRGSGEKSCRHERAFFFFSICSTLTLTYGMIK